MRVRHSSAPPALTALVVVGCLAGLAFLAGSSGASAAAAPGSSPAPATVPSTSRATTQTTKPVQLPMASAPLPSSLRGEYDWSGQGTQPAAYTSPDLYYRDQVPWSRIEPTQGTFDYSWFDAGLAQARANHGRFGFRVLAWCPGCFDNQYTHAWTQDSWIPSWLARQDGADIPDWNSEAFLSAWEDLMRHLGARYADDPALGFIDVGGYGKYGEWHADGEGAPITVANAERITRAVLDSFPTQHVVVNATEPDLVNAVLAMSPRVGLRTDCLGAPAMYSLIPSSAPGSLIAERWRTQPVLSEWCHADDDTTRGARQVTTYHVSMVSSGNTPQPYDDLPPDQQAGFRQAARYAGYRLGVTSVTVPASAAPGSSITTTLRFANTGSAPTYDDWDAAVQVLRSDNTLVSEQPVDLRLSAMLPGASARERSLTVPDVPRGSYKLRLVVRDAGGYLDPMWLSETGRRADGSYPLGSLTVS